MIARHEITGVILCGGNGERMGGVDKPLETLHGVHLVQQVRSRLVPQVARVVISANRHLDEYSAWGDVVVPDAEPGSGPLGGVVSAAAESTTAYWFCCPGDAPWLSDVLVSRLASALATGAVASPKPLLAVPHDGMRQQHLFLLCHRSVNPALQEYLAAGERSVQGWIARVPHVVVDASDLRTSFTNINNRADLTVAGQCRMPVADDAHSPPATPAEHS